MSDVAYEPIVVAEPSTELRELGSRMVGRSRLSGGVEGTSRFAWMEGGYFLIQHVDLVQHGMKINGIEIIGHLRPFGEPPSEEIRSRFYDNQGNTLDYVYELEGDTLTVWGGEKGSPAYMRATIDPDGNTRGEWVYPGEAATSSRRPASSTDPGAAVAVRRDAVMGEIDDYLAGLEQRQRRALERVRDIAQRVAPDASQGKSYGMPALRVAGKPLLGFKVGRQHLSLHPFSADVVAAVADDLVGFSLSKGTIRFTPETPVPEPIIERVVRLRLAEITGS